MFKTGTMRTYEDRLNTGFSEGCEVAGFSYMNNLWLDNGQSVLVAALTFHFHVLKHDIK